MAKKQHRTTAMIIAALLCTAFLMMPGLSTAAHNEWTWESGSDTGMQDGVYGTKGTPDAANIPGGRYGGLSWTGSSGNLWLFGGEGRDSEGTFTKMNDLWSYDIAAGKWTWISGSDTSTDYGTYGTKGTPHASNVPGPRAYGVSWTDSEGGLWLFGGLGFAASTSGKLNDLWHYDNATGEWTWISGSNISNEYGVYGTMGVPASAPAIAPPEANIPGARYGSISWIDSNDNLWLFGGYGNASDGNSGYLNDLWHYDNGTDQWTWISGSDIDGEAGVYGTMGTPDAANVPGARKDSVSWTDNGGNLWLFGGQSWNPTIGTYFFNDLWRYNPNSNEWTWMGGSNTENEPGVYGTMGTADAASIPGARRNGLTWSDDSGRLWLFGGAGYDSFGDSGYLNDLWRYDPAANLWTWMQGSTVVNELGIYGTRGSADASNVPGARHTAVSWSDAAGNLWLFGGHGSDKSSGSVFLNDLWKLERSMVIDKCNIKAGKTAGADSMQVQGLLEATEEDFIDALMGGEISVQIYSTYLQSPDDTIFSFSTDEENMNKGKYSSPKLKPADKADPATSFSYDANKGTMKFSAKNIDLTGLGCPVTFKVTIGDYVATVQMGEDIVNGEKKTCPPALGMGVFDSLEATKVKAKKSTKDDADSVSISGTFTIEGTIDTNNLVEIKLGDDTFTIPGEQFTAKKGAYSCKSYDTGNGIVSAKFDTIKCTYSIKIKNASLIESGNVDFTIDLFGNPLQASSQITLPDGPDF